MPVYMLRILLLVLLGVTSDWMWGFWSEATKVITLS